MSSHKSPRLHRNARRDRLIEAGARQINLLLLPDDLVHLNAVQDFTGENLHKVIRRLLRQEAQRVAAIRASGLAD